MSKSKAIETMGLTIMSDIDGFARSENGVSVGTVEASGIFGAVFDLRYRRDQHTVSSCIRVGDLPWHL